MRKKKILAIVLTAALATVGIGSFVSAQEEDNEVMVIFATNWNYEVVEDDFNNDEVTGWIEWHTHLWNNSDASGELIYELTQRLVSDQEFCWVTQDSLTNMGPPMYEWEFGNITEGADLMVGMSGCPELSPITFNPGFDAKRMLDETEFLQSEEPQTQTLTITLTPQDVIERFYIHVSSPQDKLVNAVIRSVEGDSDFEFDLFADGHELDISPINLEQGTTYTYTVVLDVAPEVHHVESMPFVQITWVEGSDLSEISGSSITNPIQDQEGEIGTWTLNAEGIYLWRWWEEIFGGIFWSPSSRDLSNYVEVSYTSHRIYTAPENTFANREVSGNTWWHTDLLNLPDATEEAIAGAELSLDTNLTLDWYFFGFDPSLDPPMFRLEPTRLTEEPPPYEWGFGDVGEEEMPLIFVHPTNPADEVLGTFTPGFNASVSVDRVQFLQSQGTQTQTLTIEVEKVDPDAYFILVVSSDVTSYPFLPVDEGDLVEAVIIPPFPEWTEFVFPGGTGFIMETMHMEPDETRVIEIPIEVTPKVPRVEYKPAVFLASQGPYPERQSHFGNYHSLEVDSLGTWTWNAEGEYDWQWRYIDRGAVVFPGIPPAIEDFHVEDMLIDFNPRPDHDKIDIKKATFRLQEGTTCDLAVDDVTVAVDGVVIAIPAGSFVQGKGGDYIFKSPKGVEPKVEMKLNFDKGEWHFKVDKIDASAVDNCDGVDVAFCIGYMAARETINMQIGGLSYIAEE